MKPFQEDEVREGFEMNVGEWGMHGDVILFAESELPPDFAQMPKVSDDCIAYGEATGHRHQVFGDDEAFSLRECPKTKTRYLHVVREVVLKHQEHKPVVLPPGSYRTGIQREYDPFEKRVRQVID